MEQTRGRFWITLVAAVLLGLAVVACLPGQVFGEDTGDAVGLTKESAPAGTTIKIGVDQKKVKYQFFDNLDGTKTAMVFDKGTDGNDLSEIKIPSKVYMTDDPSNIYIVNGIVGGVFSQCNKLEEITIPETVTTIGNGTFSNCKKLTSITIPSRVTEIAANTFELSGLESITFEGEVKTIGDMAFASCKALTSINIPKTVTKIKNRAFEGSGLTEIEIPENVNSMGSNPFNNCDSLQTITVNDQNKDFKVENETLYTKDGKTLVYYPLDKTGVFDILDSVETIGALAASNGQIDEIILPNTVKTLGANAFEHNDQLRKVFIPSSVGSIGGFAFQDCKALTDVTISNGVDTIEGGAFELCDNLTNITIPSSVSKIDNKGFAGCTKLGNIIMSNRSISVNAASNDVAASFYNVPANHVLVLCSDATDSIEGAISGAFPSASPTFYKGVLTPKATGSTSTVIQGKTLDLGAMVDLAVYDSAGGSAELPEGFPLNNYGFSLSGTSNPKTYISGNTLYVADDQTPGDLTVKLPMGGTLTVTVKAVPIPTPPPTPPVYLSNIQIETPPARTSYIEGETFDKTGMKVKAIYSDGGFADVTAVCTVSPTGPLTLGDKEVTVSYNSYVKTIPITVLPEEPEEVTIKTAPTKTEYTTGETFDPTGLVLGFKLGEKIVELPYTEAAGELFTFSPTLDEPLKAEQKEVTITYKGKTVSQAITVSQDYADAITLSQTKADLPLGEKLTLTATLTPENIKNKEVKWSCSDSKVAQVSNTGTITAVAPGTAVITATAAGKDGSTLTATCTVTVKPGTPEVKAVSQNYNTVKISWVKVTGAKGYELYRRTSSKGNFTKIETLEKTSYSNTKLTTGRTYAYKVRAYTTVGGEKHYGSHSKAVEAMPKPNTPDFDLTAGKGQITVKWKNIKGADGYIVYRASSKNGEYKKIKVIRDKGGKYTNTKLTGGRTYYYKMKSYTQVKGKNTYSSTSEALGKKVR